MGADFWAAVAAIAAAISTLLTFIVVGVSFFTARQDAKASDFTSCLDVVTRLADAQRRVRDARDNEDVRQFELRELLNLMEALALLENGNRITPSTRKFTGHFLEEAWAYIRSEPSLRPLLENSITGDETFLELSKFAERRAGKIERLTKHYENSRSGQSQFD
jgi:hypothetical protein